MNNSELVKVGRTGYDPRKLKIMKDHKSKIDGRISNELTNCKRFASRLDLVYSITFPFRIQSETIRKLRGSVEIETPNSGRMLG